MGEKCDGMHGEREIGLECSCMMIVMFGETHKPQVITYTSHDQAGARLGTSVSGRLAQPAQPDFGSSDLAFHRPTRRIRGKLSSV